MRCFLVFSTILFIAIGFLNCNQISNKKINLKESISVNQITTEDSIIKPFLFRFSFSDSIVVKGIKFFEIESDFSNKSTLFLGARNDTIFSFEKEINFIDIFAILNSSNKNYKIRFGTDYLAKLKDFRYDINLKDSIYIIEYSLPFLEDNVDDNIYLHDEVEYNMKKIIISRKKGIIYFTLADSTQTLYTPHYVNPVTTE